MKRILAALTAFMMISNVSGAQGEEKSSFDRWTSDKYSMFIHFGLYSHLGGVWDGVPVRSGYSEQIQSFAGIFSDWYAETAYEFNPVNFNADQIALLAKESGMRSIIFTSKHHDGFCMYETATTGYDSMEMLPDGRDFVKELSGACDRHGLKFGLYYSLIDWNFPHAYPISSHNADFVTAEHHEFSKAQVRELLTGYGKICELWFDMGSLEPWQSKELYDLVKSIQPDCMVSGRLGNDFYDFAVMADNRLPQTALHAPWQSAASMFSETWSYRSWQERGDVSDKVAEKLRSLIDVVSRGGNYLLNIGPAADGSVVPFESDVLLSIGKWLKENGNAVYGTQASPFFDEFEWGRMTMNENRLYLLLSGNCPEDGRIVLPLNGRLRASEGAQADMTAEGCVVKVTRQMYADPTDVHVVELVFDGAVPSMIHKDGISQYETLSWSNAQPQYSYSCFDYYSNYRSTVSYQWNVDVRKRVDELELIFTPDEEGRTLVLEVDDMKVPLTLHGSAVHDHSTHADVSGYGYRQMRGGVFDGPESWKDVDYESFAQSEPLIEKPVRQFSNHLMKANVEAVESGLFVLKVTAGNGLEAVVNGQCQAKHLNPYRKVSNTENLLVDLQKGNNTILIRSYNRFEDSLSIGLRPADGQRILSMKVTLPAELAKGQKVIKVYASDRESVHADCLLHNLRINMVL